ncbi:MAG: hypothetical protein J0665_19815 [Deltaproteobacteria bacterium]|nr:hypothetical protein [Deltaproteobacteria bacterium]
MNAVEIMNQLKADNIILEVSNNGRLDISGNKKKIGKILPFIRDHKAEIINLLSKGSTIAEEAEVTRHHGLDPGRTWKPNNPFVCECGFKTGWLRDGKPLCPACDGKHPASMPEGARLNDNNQGIPSTGPCLICGVPLDQDGRDCWHRAFHMQTVKPQPEATAPPLKSEGCEDNSKLSLPYDDPEMDAAFNPAKMTSQISPVALSWLAENRVRLKDAGWTGRELYRRNKSKGICWCTLWSEPFIKPYLHETGVIEFECVIAGKDIIQTARPMQQARKLQGDK